jgi:hypothetical protein
MSANRMRLGILVICLVTVLVAALIRRLPLGGSPSETGGPSGIMLDLVGEEEVGGPSRHLDREPVFPLFNLRDVLLEIRGYIDSPGECRWWWLSSPTGSGVDLLFAYLSHFARTGTVVFTEQWDVWLVDQRNIDTLPKGLELGRHTLLLVRDELLTLERLETFLTAIARKTTRSQHKARILLGNWQAAWQLVFRPEESQILQHLYRYSPLRVPLLDEAMLRRVTRTILGDTSPFVTAFQERRETLFKVSMGRLIFLKIHLDEQKSSPAQERESLLTRIKSEAEKLQDAFREGGVLDTCGKHAGLWILSRRWLSEFLPAQAIDGPCQRRLSDLQRALRWEHVTRAGRGYSRLMALHLLDLLLVDLERERDLSLINEAWQRYPEDTALSLLELIQEVPEHTIEESFRFKPDGSGPQHWWATLHGMVVEASPKLAASSWPLLGMHFAEANPKDSSGLPLVVGLLGAMMRVDPKRISEEYQSLWRAVEALAQVEKTARDRRVQYYIARILHDMVQGYSEAKDAHGVRGTIHFLQGFRQTHPDHADVVNLLIEALHTAASFYIDQGDFEPAIQYLEIARAELTRSLGSASLDPYMTNAVNLISALQHADRIERGIEVFKDVRRLVNTADFPQSLYAVWAAVVNNAIRLHRKTGQMREVSEILEELVVLTETQEVSWEVEQWAAEAALNTIVIFGRQQHWEGVQRSLAILEMYANKVPRSRYFDYKLVRGHSDALVWYGSGRHLGGMSRALERVTDLAVRYSDDKNFQMTAAQGAYVALSHWFDQGVPDEGIRAFRILARVTEKDLQNKELQGLLLAGAIDASGRLSNVNRLDLMAEIFDVVDERAEHLQDNEETELRRLQAYPHYAVQLAKAGQTKRLFAIVDRMAEITERFAAAEPFGHHYALGMLGVVHALRMANAYTVVPDIAGRARAMSLKYPGNKDMPVMMGMSALGMMEAKWREGNDADAEGYWKELERLWVQHGDNRWMQLVFADALSTRLKRFMEVERLSEAAGLLRRVREDVTGETRALLKFRSLKGALVWVAERWPFAQEAETAVLICELIGAIHIDDRPGEEVTASYQRAVERCTELETFNKVTR